MTSYTEPVCWLTELYGEWCVVRAKSRSAARYATIRSARNAGYKTDFLARVRVRRAAEFDENEIGTGECHSFDAALAESGARRNKRIDRALADTDRVLARLARDAGRGEG